MGRKNSDIEGFTLGNIDVIRNGSIVSISNNGEENEYEKMINIMANGYELEVNKINKLVCEIKELISICNPLELLKYAYDKFKFSLMDITFESQLSSKEVYAARELEYIQSILVSSENKYDDTKTNINYQEIFEQISEKISELYNSSMTYLIFRTAYLKDKENIELNMEEESFLVESQISMFIRGDRYQIYEVPRLKELLLPHNDEFMKIYNLTVEEFIEGIESIQKSLTSVGGDFIHRVEYMMDQFNKFVDKYYNKEDASIDETMKEFHKYVESNDQLKKYSQNMIDSMQGYGQFKLKNLTTWPISFMEDLSFKINENETFFNNKEYQGWPLIEMPIYQRPFIQIDDDFYCFDYYNLFDNIYRVVEKTLNKKDSNYRATWSKRQMDTTENIVSNLFNKLLPGCEILMSNYYPINKSLKKCAENDLLVIYEDNLIIIEVKAGSYSYRSPILDIESHIKSLKTLVEKADGQAERTLDYLKSDKVVKLYDENKKEKYSLSLSDFNDITLMCVTLDNFNEFAAKIEKLSFLNLNKSTIAISMDDLKVYSDYFDSPLIFLHFLKQRKLATKNKSLYLNDELDHLGMYIKHNIYADYFCSEDCKHIKAVGYRDEIDEYFGGLVNNFLHIEKPEPYIPKVIKEIIGAIEKSPLNKDRNRVSSFLLSFCSDAKDELSDKIEEVLIKQKEVGRMMALSLFGETPVSVYCFQENIIQMSKQSIENYTLATMLNVKDDFRIELQLFYDNYNKIYDVKYKTYTRDDIHEDRLEYLNKLGKEYANTRIQSFRKQQDRKKIGRNQECPCGSGKKYKKCHGK